MKLFGLAGTLNAGKDILGNLLQEKHGYLHVSTSDLIRALKRRQFGDTPEALLVRNDPFINELRAQKGPGFLIDEVINEWEAQKDRYPNGVIASGIRAIGEVERIHELGGSVIFVDADPQVRYERSIKRGRDVQDRLTFEEFMAAERSEIDVDPEDKNTQNLAAMQKMADIHIKNNDQTLEEFVISASKILEPYI